MNLKQIHDLPKIELHCHLDGSLSKEFMEEATGRMINPDEIQVDQCENLAEYLEKFEIPVACIQTEKNLEKAGYDFIRTVAGENVGYVEVRFAPLLSVHESLTTEKVIIAVLNGLRTGKFEFGVDYNVITCAMRHHNEDDNLAMLRTARGFLGEGVCAADLAGDEAGFPMQEFMGLYSQVKAMDMPFTLHAGETGNYKNIIDAVEIGAARIGHGIAMRGHESVQKLCRNNRIGIEMCPISNMQTKAVPNMKGYPMREFLDNELLVTINTDNRTVSHTSISKELEYIQKEFNVCDEEIHTITKNAIDVSFANDTIKDRLYRTCL